MSDQLNRIEEALEALAKKEKRTNGFQLWLWLINVVVLPALAFCLFHVVQIIGNRYTSRDAMDHQRVHQSEAMELAKVQAKLAGLPPAQIDENRLAIDRLKTEIQKIKLERATKND